MQDIDSLYRHHTFREMANDLEPFTEEIPIITKRRTQPPKNSIFIIHPFRRMGVWAFTDPEAGLTNEPFVGEINEMIDHLVKDIPGAEDGFNLLFSATPMPKFQLSFTLSKARVDMPAEFHAQYENEIGATYLCDQLGIEGWLCPALFCYFTEPPAKLYVRAEKARK